MLPGEAAGAMVRELERMLECQETGTRAFLINVSRGKPVSAQVKVGRTVQAVLVSS